MDIFHHLTPSQRKHLEEISILRHYEGGEILFYQGDASDYFHFLLHGEVSLYKTNDHEILHLHRFIAPSMIAEVATLNALAFPATAETLTPCTLLKIAKVPFIELLERDAGLSIAMMRSLMTKIGTLERTIEQLNAPNSLTKVVRLMLQRPHLFTQLTGKELSTTLGMTPETLSRTLTKLKKEGLIAYQPHKHFEILNLTKLQAYN
ncbi:MAG: Crp/Fnr family transcriptional regulator [Sulfuricurvum sp.]|jgi:CRP/FNR family transcriptional regulator